MPKFTARVLCGCVANRKTAAGKQRYRCLGCGASRSGERPDVGLDIASTTNRIEGGTNAQLRLMLRAHRGMSEDHQKRAIEWYLYLHSEQFRPPATLIEARHYNPPKTKAIQTEQEPGPELYSKGLTADEGLWHRKGWAGRS